MTSSFTVRSAAGYERLMGRWSRVLAGPFIDFAGVADGERVLDVGCGTGSLTFALPQAAEVGEVEAIDYSPVFVEEAKWRNTDPRITIAQGDACAIPFPDGRFDRALALLVLHFVPKAEKAVAEMRRVVRPGGVVAAAVWDHLGGMSGMRMMWDTVAAQDEEARRLRGQYCFQPMMRPDEMRQSFVSAGPRERGADLAANPDGVRELRGLLGADRRRRGAARQVRGGARPGAPGQSRRGGPGRLRGRSARRPALLRGGGLGLPGCGAGAGVRGRCGGRARGEAGPLSGLA